jgi:LuxR family maltose regulon positive regulatory protein
MQGDLETAARWARDSGYGVSDRLEYHQVDSYYTYARVLFFQAKEDPGKLHEAQQLLARLLQVVLAAGARGLELVLLVFQAQLLQQQQDHEGALDALERALSLAAPEGIARAFLDAGPAIVPLLRQAAARGTAAEHVDKLLAALDAETGKHSQINGALSPAPAKTLLAPSLSSLVEPLTDREMEVLQLLATPLSTPEIAAQLYISVSTVRSHVKSIYGKLGVHSRIEAVARAQELELL